MTETSEHPFTVIVGVDGSKNSLTALRWAVDEARAHGGRVRVLHAWTSPYAWPSEPIFPVDVDKLRTAAQQRLDEALASVVDSGVDVQGDIFEGDARHALVDAAQDAQLLVLGTRGHTALADVLIGSVSLYCSHHASCPVVLVPGARGR